jgi:hypothetical protein
MTIALNIVKVILIAYNLLIMVGLLLNVKEEKGNLFNWLLFFFSGITMVYLLIK